MEEENTHFYMCDFSPKNFGYSEYYQLKVSNVEGIMSETQVSRKLQGQPCVESADCVYGTLCKTMCNTRTNTCLGVTDTQKPDLIKICEILLDYILYDTPIDMKQMLGELIAECSRLGRESYTRSIVEQQVEQNVVLERLKALLWDRLKNEDNYWLYKATELPFG